MHYDALCSIQLHVLSTDILHVRHLSDASFQKNLNVLVVVVEAVVVKETKPQHPGKRVVCLSDIYSKV